MAESIKIIEKYGLKLRELSWNSRPLIIGLTALAQENIAHAEDVVEVIEAYLTDRKTRIELLHLRNTWNSILPADILISLDAKLALLPLPSSSNQTIHQNSEYLIQKQFELEQSKLQQEISLLQIGLQNQSNITNSNQLHHKDLRLRQHQNSNEHYTNSVLTERKPSLLTNADQSYRFDFSIAKGTKRLPTDCEFPNPKKYKNEVAPNYHAAVSLGSNTFRDGNRQGIVEYRHPDSVKSLPIFGQQRELRYYENTTIVFMNANDPREIIFTRGTRKIYFNNRFHKLFFNARNKDIIINGNVYQVRFGAPSREVFINNIGYQCCFDDIERTIVLNGIPTTIKLESPPPQISVKQKRRLDLVAGKIQLLVNGAKSFSLFLDAKVQYFEVDGINHSLKFVDALLAVMIDNVRFVTKYNGDPMFLNLPSGNFNFQFSSLPEGIIPGQIFIKDMEVYPNPINSTSLNFSDVNQTSAEVTPSCSSDIPETSPKVNIQDLYQNLVRMGIISSNNCKPIQDNRISFDNLESLQSRSLKVIRPLESGTQCYHCGIRFPVDQSEHYQEHISWHVRKNRKLKEKRKLVSKSWFYKKSDWMNYIEMEYSEERKDSYFEDVAKTLVESKIEEKKGIPYVPADSGAELTECEVCREKFDYHFDDEDEEWKLANAIRVDGQTFHPVCYEDYKK